MGKDVIKNILKERTLYRDEIYQYMKNAILNGDLKPGERIVETRWARKLGVSQSPVREAIMELEMVGLVENKPFSGTFVKEITVKEVLDAYRVRVNLEVLGVEEAIHRITDEELEDIHTTMIEMQRAAAEGDNSGFIEKDALFHQKIMEASNNSMLIKLWKQCKIVLSTHFSATMSSKDLSCLALRHDEIYDALKSRDKERAIKVISNHIEELRREVKENIK